MRRLINDLSLLIKVESCLVSSRPLLGLVFGQCVDEFGFCDWVKFF